VRVPPDLYLDVRKPVWLDAELHGHVRYDDLNRLVVVSEHAVGIQMVLKDALAR
jgi:hypothetical protein